MKLEAANAQTGIETNCVRGPENTATVLEAANAQTGIETDHQGDGDRLNLVSRLEAANAQTGIETPPTGAGSGTVSGIRSSECSNGH